MQMAGASCTNLDKVTEFLYIVWRWGRARLHRIHGWIYELAGVSCFCWGLDRFSFPWFLF